MNFKVKIDDFWLEEDEDIETALKNHIIISCVHKITKSIEDRVETQIQQSVTRLMDEKMEAVIDQKITEFLETGELTKNRETIQISDYLKKVFTEGTGWNNPTTTMKKFGENWGKEMRLRYDALFANHIVQGMKEQGLLKDDVVQMLLTGPDK